MTRTRRALLLALVGVALLALVSAALPAWAQTPGTSDPLTAYGIPAGLGGAVSLPLATWMVLRALGLWPPRERRSEQPGRRAADEEGSVALKVITAEGWATLLERIERIDKQVASLDKWRHAEELATVRHEGDHRELVATIAGLRLAVEAAVRAGPPAG